MLQTLHPYTPTAKTAEIMARYRPIAPKPQPAAASNTGGGSIDEGSGSGSGSGSSPPTMSRTIRQSPYLRNVWPHLQSRPTRTRKRGRTSLGPPPLAAFKRPRTLLQGLSPPFHITTSPAKTLSLQGFEPTTLVTLPLLQPHHMQMQIQMQSDIIDLNKAAEIPEEQDLLAQLQKPPTATVISPTPIRLIRSTVTIRAIKPDQPSHKIVLKPSEQIEQELESQTMPAFVSDSNHQVRLVNSSYQEMVGQPECEWVQSMVATCNSICGNVVLKFTDLENDNDNDNDNDNEDVIGSGFSCWARIEWGANGKRNMVNAFGEVKRLACESKDYKFAWRFHTRQAAAAAVENVQDQDQDMESVNLKRHS